MNDIRFSAPESDEYAAYYEKYIELVDRTDVLLDMEEQLHEFTELLEQIPEIRGSFAYAEGKWSIKEVIGHLIDGERVFSYRAYRISRNDQTALAGFEQDDYVANGHFNSSSLADLIAEFSLLRRANLIFFRSLTDEARRFVGTASGARVSVRALAFMMVGHVRHHVNILNTKYLI